MSKKDLVILGSYPASDKVKSILKDCINSLKSDFDIMLCTHYPADFDTQSSVNYYIYDYRNEMVVNEDVFIYGDSPQFYFQGYIEGTSTHPGFAIIRSIVNGVKFASGYYDGFYYIEGDAVFSAEDIKKIKLTKEAAVAAGKQAWFFKLDQVLSSNIFYCNTDFFTKNFIECKTVEEYNALCQKIGSFGILENFLYKYMEHINQMQNLHLIENVHFTDYFSDSKMSLSSFREDGMIHPFELRLVKVENSDKIAYVYMNNNNKPTSETIEFKVNDTITRQLPLGLCYQSEIIDSDADYFMMQVGNYTKKYTREAIFKSKSFVRYK